MNTEISTKMNDCLSDSFESKTDPFFTSALQEDRYGRYRRWDKDDARSALARPPRSKGWCKGIIGVKSPNSKD